MKKIDGTVEVTVKDAAGVERTESAAVTYQELENAEDVLSVASDEKLLAVLIANANYGANLKARSAVRQAILDRLQGPDKAINKMVNDLVKMRAAVGKPITEEEARKLVLALQ